MSPVDFTMLEHAAAREGAAELRGFAVSALEAAAAGRHAVRAVRHPLGFVCLPVLRDGGCGVCVHLFEPGGSGPGPRPTTSGLHSHSWRLTSCVLYGEVVNVRLRVCEAAERPTHRIFEVRSDPAGVDEIRPTPRLARCSRGEAQVSAEGEIYTLPAGEFHTTVVSYRAAAATVVLGRAVPGRVDLSLGPVHGAAHRVVRHRSDATQTARIARAALGRINGSDEAA